jgi:hypothetical protein
MERLHSKQSQSTDVWTANANLVSASGVTIPAGTELTLATYMPEGFVALSLAVNIEGETLQVFDRRAEQIPSFRAPQFLYLRSDLE